MAKNHWYVGLATNGLRECFQAKAKPTEATHGNKYLAVIGPFRTHAGAIVMQRYGQGNPHIQHVDDAERLVPQFII